MENDPLILGISMGIKKSIFSMVSFHKLKRLLRAEESQDCKKNNGTVLLRTVAFISSIKMVKKKMQNSGIEPRAQGSMGIWLTHWAKDHTTKEPTASR